RAHVPHVLEAHRVGPVLGEHATAVFVLLHLPDRAHPRALQAQLKATDTREQTADRQHGITPSPAPRIPVWRTPTEVSNVRSHGRVRGCARGTESGTETSRPLWVGWTPTQGETRGEPTHPSFLPQICESLQRIDLRR